MKNYNLFGFNLNITRKRKFKEYEWIFPQANYAPWLADKRFNDVYEKIKNYTSVDKYKCYELWQLISETKKLKGALIEVGVWKGGSGCLIAKKSELEGIKDAVYLCDTFKGLVKANKIHDNHENGKYSCSKEFAEELIKKLELKNIKILEGIFPEETGKEIAENKFRFCHIDVDVYQSIKDVVEWIWDKLAIGGIIVSDDYGFMGCEGITKFINEERKKKDRLVIHNLNGHAIIIKIK